MPKLLQAKSLQNVRKKTPQFNHIRRQLHLKKTPKVHMEIAFKKKDTGEVIIVEDAEVAPKSRFPGHLYEKLYETATVKVINPTIFF